MTRTRSLKRFMTALLVAAMLTAALAPAALAVTPARIFSNARVYIAPSTDSRSVVAPNGYPVAVTATYNGWAQIYNQYGYVGYIPIPYLDLANRLTAYTNRSTPVYWQPSTGSGVMGTLSIATAVYVTNKIGNFYRVQNSSGSVSGYVEDGYLASYAQMSAAYNAYRAQQAAASAPSGGSSAADRLLAGMRALCGRPYSSGASIYDAPGSFNCSTFVRYVMAQFGINVSGTAAEQAFNGSPVSASDLMLGDILCFDGNGDGVCDHTAIYAGGTNFVDASQSAGQVIWHSSINDWYRSHFMGARRVR